MCSSSLTAVHLACESLRRGECGLAIAGGVNLSLHPYKYVFLTPGQFVSTTAAAAASARRRRLRARRGRRRRAAEAAGPGGAPTATTSTASSGGARVNHGGRTNGYTVPNPHAQARGDRARRCGRPASSRATVSYIEAHGTGTALGDPIEIAGLAKAFRRRPTAVPDARLLRDRLGEVEHRPLRGGRGHRRADQGAAADAARRARRRRCTPTSPTRNIDFGADAVRRAAYV